MRKGNKVAQLNRTASHRRAMLANMVTSLFYHEHIESTFPKTKAAQQLAEKLITRAKANLEADTSAKVHNIRMAGRIIKDREVLVKLFDDIAHRFANRAGGYTRVLRIGRRESDASEMAVLQLVEKKPLATLKAERKEVRAKVPGSRKPKSAPAKKSDAAKAEKSASESKAAEKKAPEKKAKEKKEKK